MASEVHTKALIKISKIALFRVHKHGKSWDLFRPLVASFLFDLDDFITVQACDTFSFGLSCISCSSFFWILDDETSSDILLPLRDNEMNSELIKATVERPAEIRKTVPMKEFFVA